METAEQIVGLLSLLVNTLVSAAIGFAVAVLVLRGPTLLLRALGVQKMGDGTPGNYILFIIPLFGLLVTGIFVFMTFRIDRGARQEAREAAIEYVETTARDAARNEARNAARGPARDAARETARAIAETVARETASSTATSVAEDVVNSAVRDTAERIALDVAESVAAEVAGSAADRTSEEVLNEMADKLDQQMETTRSIAERVATMTSERIVDEARTRITDIVELLASTSTASLENAPGDTLASDLFRWTEAYWRSITDVPSDAEGLEIGMLLSVNVEREETEWLYFTVPADGDGMYEVSARARYFTDAVVALYSAEEEGLTYIGYNDDENEDSLDALYSTQLSAEVTYYIGVSDAFGSAGRVDVLVERAVGIATGAGVDAGVSTMRLAIDFGDDTSDMARDGECDDPRFDGDGAALLLLMENRGRDATDCRELLDEGRIQLYGVDLESGDIDFGDDTSNWAQDRECDDPRFDGDGMARRLLYSNRGRDAGDCRQLYEAGRIRLFGVDDENVR